MIEDGYVLGQCLGWGGLRRMQAVDPIMAGDRSKPWLEGLEGIVGVTFHMGQERILNGVVDHSGWQRSGSGSAATSH